VGAHLDIGDKFTSCNDDTGTLVATDKGNLGGLFLTSVSLNL
jgi:hypothetical protein